MTGLLLALIGAVIVGIGARDQTAVARLTGAQGPRPSVLVIGVAMSFATAACAAWAASVVPAEGRLLLAWLAIVLAGVEMLAMVPGRAPKEPTRSLFALAVVLAVHQLTDAARFLIFAVAVLTAAPLPAGIGGAMGGAMALSAAWLAPRFLGDARIGHWRQIAGAAMLLLLVTITALRL